MNSQNFHQLYNPPSSGPTAEQLATFQKQQQMFLQQQQQYMMQQQQLQKQMMREEQRNRLKNMNVKSMGVSTFQQHTSSMQLQPSNYPSNFPASNNNCYQATSNFPTHQQYTGSSFPQGQSFPQTSMQHYQPIVPAQTITPAQSVNPMQTMTPGQTMNPVQTMAPVQPISASRPQINPAISNSGLWNDHMSGAAVQNRMNVPVASSNVDYNSLGGSTNNCSSGFSVNNKTDDHAFIVPPSVASFPSVAGVFDKEEGLSTAFCRSDSDEFGDFASTVKSFPPAEQNVVTQSNNSTITTISSSGSTSYNLQGLFQSDATLNLASSVPSKKEVGALAAVSYPNMFDLNTSSSLSSATATNSNFPDLLQSDASLGVSQSSTVLSNLSNLSEPVLVPQNHSTAEQIESASVTTVNNQDTVDEFDDFQAAAVPETLSVSNTLESSFSQQNKASEQVYVPGSLTNENADVIYSVAIFSNPIKAESTPKPNDSALDQLINKSLSGKSSKSNVRSLFKPAQKPSIPSTKSTVTPSDKAADWGSLNLGDVFQIPAQEEDDFGEFSSKLPEPTRQQDVFNMASSSPAVSVPSVAKPLESPVESDDVFSLFSSSKPSSRYDKVPYISEGTLDSVNEKVGITDLLGLTTAKSEFKKTSNSILDIFGGNSASKKENKKSESSDLDWSDFTSTSCSNEQQKPHTSEPDLVPTVGTSPSNLNMDKIPSLYKDVIDFCNTPSGIIDVGKVYEVLLTDKFKVVALQPLMSQCKMMGNPTAKDLVDLLGIVGLKQKGFPTPSKYELNYQKLPIPSVNMSAIKKNKSNQKVDKGEQPTLLSFVSQDAEKKVPSLAPVFDFGISSSKDLSCAPFAGEASSNEGVLATDVSVTNDEDDWGDFGSVSEPTTKSDFSWDKPQLVDFTPSTKSSPVVDLLQEPITAALPTPSLTVSLPKPRSAVPLKLDEPPPLSDNDDEDWADFAHPAHKWDIDPDEIEEQAVNNAASKNRWGTVSVSSEKGQGVENYHDKDYSHVAVEMGDSKTEAPSFFAADFATLPLTKIDLPKSDDQSARIEPSPETPAETVVSISDGKEDRTIKHKLDLDSEDVFVEATTAKAKAVQKDLDKLASPDGEVSQFVSPFADLTESTPQNFDEFFDNSGQSFDWGNDESTAPNFDSPFADFGKDESAAPNFDSSFADFGNDLTKDGSAAPNFDSPFADFGNEKTEAATESGDFGEFTTSVDQGTDDKGTQEMESSDPDFADFKSGAEKTLDEEDAEFSDFCGTGENDDSAKDTLTESLKLTNLPKKDLDGFWNDMVDTLGAKADRVPVFDLEESAPKQAPELATENPVSVPAMPQPVSYDALKEESFDNEEDRVGAWSKCLSMILTILIQCQTLFGASGVPSIQQEIVESEKGKLYLDCCTEVFRVACRISVAGASDDGIVEIFKEIKHTWTLISEMLDDSIDLPNIRDFNIQSAETVDEFSGRNCGICLLDTGVENKTSKLRYNGVFYHVTCANFWVNTVNPLLPNLNCKLEDPLL